MWPYILLLGLVLYVANESKKCPDKFTLIDGKCYKVVENYLSTWDNAKYYCQQLGGTLINIENEAQMVGLGKHLVSMRSTDVYDAFWTGNICIEALNQWTPNEVNGCRQIIYWSGDFYVNRQKCDEQNKFICEAPTKKEEKESKLTAFKCPEKFKLIGEKCYYIEKNKELTLDSARNKCTKLQAQLANVQSDIEFNALKKELFTNPKALEEFHIYRDKNNMFDLNILFIYNDSENCLWLAQYGSKYRMKMGRCSGVFLFVCETTTFIETETETEADESSDANCLNGFTKVGDKCYFVDNKNLLNWFEAYNECKGRTAKLIKIENDEQMKALSDHLLHLDCKDSEYAFWTGGNDINQKRILSWNQDYDVMNYTKWYTDQPIWDESESLYGRCVELAYTNGEYFMNIQGSSHLNYYICETNFEKQIGNLYVENQNTENESILKENTGNENTKSTEVQACPKDFQQFDKKCYRYEVEECDWFDANERCEAMNSKIARIENSIEMANLNIYLLNENVNDDLWISGDDIINEGTYVLDEHYNVVPYTHFGKNDDDVRLANSQWNCLGLTKYDEFYMKIFDCREEKTFICEVKAEGLLDEVEVEESTTTTELIPEDTTTEINVEPTETVANDACPKNFVQHGEKCYYIEMEKQNWFNAHHSCSELNAQLVTIENAYEMRILTKYLIENLNDSNGNITAGFWTTGNDLGSENDFHWNSNGKTMTYTKWHMDEPNNYENEDCVLVTYNNDEYFMNDLDCSIENRFICEIKVSTKLTT